MYTPMKIIRTWHTRAIYSNNKYVSVIVVNIWIVGRHWQLHDMQPHCFKSQLQKVEDGFSCICFIMSWPLNWNQNIISCGWNFPGLPPISVYPSSVKSGIIMEIPSPQLHHLSIIPWRILPKLTTHLAEQEFQIEKQGINIRWVPIFATSAWRLSA